MGIEEGEQAKTAPALERTVAVFNNPCGMWIPSKGERTHLRSRGGEGTAGGRRSLKRGRGKSRFNDVNFLSILIARTMTDQRDQGGIFCVMP